MHVYMRERARAKMSKEENINKDVPMHPLTVDEAPEAAIMERADTLEAWYTGWLYKNIYLACQPITLKKALYGAEGDSKRENKGIGSAITFRRYLNGKVWASNPAYLIYQDAGGERWVDRT